MGVNKNIQCRAGANGVEDAAISLTSLIMLAVFVSLIIVSLIYLTQKSISSTIV